MIRTHAVAVAVLLATAPALAEEFPHDRIEEDLRPEVRRVTGDATVKAPIGPKKLTCPPGLYRYLLTHLPLSARWQRALGYGDYAIRELEGGQIEIDDREGAKADCAFGLEEPGELVLVARGTLEVPVLPKIKGTGVIQIRYPPTPKGTPDQLTCSALVYFRVESAFLHAVSRPFRKTLAKVLGQKMEKLVEGAIKLAEAIHADPTGCYAKLKQSKASPEDLVAFRDRFLLH